MAVGYFVTFLLFEPSYVETNNIYLQIKGKEFVCQKFKLLLLELSKKFSGRVTLSGSGWSRRLEIELNGMPITVEVAELIISHLKELSVWSKLVIQNCNISSDGLLHITEALQKTDYSHLNELQFVDTNLENHSLQIRSSFKKLLEMNKSLTHLHLIRSGFITESHHYIFQGLQSNITL